MPARTMPARRGRSRPTRWRTAASIPSVRARRVVTVVVVLGLVAGFGFWLANRWESPQLPAFGPDCTVEADGRVGLDRDQMANAATITAVGVRLGMPDRAMVVA